MINCSLLSWEGGNPLHHLKMCGVFHPVLGEDILGSLGTESLIYAVLRTRQWRTSDTMWYSFSWKGPSLETNLPFNYWTSGRSISCLTQATHRREFATMSAGDVWRLQLKEILLCKEDSCLHPQTFVLHSSNQYTHLLFWWVCCGSSGGWGTRTGPVKKLHIELQRPAKGSGWCFLFLCTCSYWSFWGSWPLLAVARLGEVLTDLFKSVDLMNKSTF